MLVEELFIETSLMESVKRCIGRKSGKRFECYRVTAGAEEGKLVETPAMLGVPGIKKQLQLSPEVI
jgi:hypothetical protein